MSKLRFSLKLVFSTFLVFLWACLKISGILGSEFCRVVSWYSLHCFFLGVSCFLEVVLVTFCLLVFCFTLEVFGGLGERRTFRIPAFWLCFPDALWVLVFWLCVMAHLVLALFCWSVKISLSASSS